MRRAGFLLITLAVLFGSHSVAWANQENASGHVYVSQFEDCAYAYVHMDNEAANPLVWTYGSMDWWNGNASCGATNALARAGTLSVGQDLLYLDFADNRWKYCNIGAWYYNQTTTHDMSTSWSAQRPCGQRWYVLNGYARTWNGSWHGGYNQTRVIIAR